MGPRGFEQISVLKLGSYHNITGWLSFKVFPPSLISISARYEDVPIWRTYGKYRKEMKRGYSKLLYNQRNKEETIMSVIKRLFGEYIASRLVRTQNREISFKCIA
jgi:hypothetical protein